MVVKLNLWYNKGMVSKKQQAKELYESGQKTKALAIVKKWPNLGLYRDDILRGSDCINNPRFYEQLGYNIDDCVAKCYKSLELLIF